MRDAPPHGRIIWLIGWSVAFYFSAMLIGTFFSDVEPIRGATNLTITGRVYTDAGTTKMGAGKTVTVYMNGTALGGSDDTDAGGMYSITNLTMTSGTIVTLFLDDETEKGVTVTLGSGSNMTGVDLYQNSLILRSDKVGTALEGVALDVSDNSADADVLAVYNMYRQLADGGYGSSDTDRLSTKTNTRLVVWEGTAVTLSGLSSYAAAGSGMILKGSLGGASMYVSGSILSVGGSTTAFAVTIGDVSVPYTITTNGTPLPSLLISATATGTGSLGSNFTASGVLSVTASAGTFDANDYNVKVVGDVVLANSRVKLGNGTWTVSGNWDSRSVSTVDREQSKVVLDGTNKTFSGATTTATSLKHLSVSGSIIFGTTTRTSDGNIVIAGTANVKTGNSLALYGIGSNGNLYVYPGGSIIGNGGLYLQKMNIAQQDGTISVATFTYRGITSGTFAAGTYSSPTVRIGSESGNATITAGAGTLLFTGNVQFHHTGSSQRLIVDNSVNNPNWAFQGRAILKSDTTGEVVWAKGSGTMTFSGSTTDQFVNLNAEHVEDIVVNKSSGTLGLSGSGTTDSITLTSGTFRQNGLMLTVSDFVAINAGVFNTGTGTLNVAGNFTNKAQYLTTNGSVVLNGGNQTLSGSTSFYNLTKTVTSAATLTLASTKTQTVSGALTLQGASSNLLSLRATSNGIKANLKLITGATQSLEYLDVKDSDASAGQELVCYTSSEGCVNSGNTTNWLFQIVTAIITGKVFTDEGVTKISAGKTVSMSVNGGTNTDSALTDGGGQFSLSGAVMTGGTLITLYLDGNTEKGVTVTVGSGSNMTGVNIYQNRLIARSDSGSVAMTNARLAIADNNGDSDISSIYTINSSVLNVKSGKALTVWTGDTFTPGAAVNVGSGITINGTFTTSSNTVTLSGSWITNPTASFTNTNLVTFDGTAAGTRVISSTGSTFSGITIASANSSVYRLGSKLTMSGTLTLSAGTYVFDARGNDLRIEGHVDASNSEMRYGNGDWIVTGNWDNFGVTTVDIDESHITFDGTGTTISTATYVPSYYDVTFAGNTTLTENAFNVNGLMTIEENVRVYNDVSGSSISLDQPESDLQIKPGARLEGGLFDSSVFVNSGASISQQDGYINAFVYLIGQHDGPTETIAPANYSSYIIFYNTNGLDMKVAFENGDYTFLSMLFGTVVGGNIFINNARHDPNFYYSTGTAFSLADVGDGTGKVHWQAGTGAITLSGTFDADLHLLGQTIETVIVDNGTNYVRMVSTGAVLGLTMQNGNFMQNGQAFDIIGDLTLEAGGKYTASAAAPLDLSGNLFNEGGQFIAGTGTVILNGANQTLSGSTSFYNLTKTVTSAATLTLASTKTQTVSGALTLQGAASNLLSLRATTEGVKAKLNLVSGGTQDLEYLDVQDNDASGGQELLCYDTDGCIDSGNLLNWLIQTAAIITGKVFTDEGITKIAAGKTVSMSVNGGANTDSALTDGGGQFTLSGATMTGGSIVTLYLDGNTEKGVTVTLGSGSNMTGVNIYQNRLIVRSDSGSTAMTNARLTVADNNGDSDISSIYSINSNVLNVKAGKALTVWSGDTFTPGAAVNVGSGITINGTFTMGTSNVTLSGSWIANTGGQFTASNLVIFDGTGNSRRFIRPNASSFSGVTITSASSAIWTLSGSAFNLSGSLTLSSGTWTFDNSRHDLSPRIQGNVTTANSVFQMGDGTWTVSGNWSHTSSATVSRNASTLVMNGSGKTINTSTSAAKALNHLTIDGYVSVATGLQIAGTLTVNTGKKLTIGSGLNSTVQTDAGDIIVATGGRISGAGQLGVQTGASISTMNGVIDTTTMSILGNHGGAGNRLAAATYHAGTVTIATFGGTSTAFIEFDAGTVTFEGNVQFASLSPAMTVDNTVNNPNFVFKKNVAFSQTATLTWLKGTGTITFSGTTNQDLNFLNKSLEDIIVNKSSGNASLITNGVTTESFTLTSGTFEQRGLSLTVTDDVTLNGGTFKQGSGTLTVAGDLTNKAQFTTTNGSVILDGTNQTLSGSTTFYNLTKSVSSPATLTLASTKTQTVSGALVLQGAASNLLSLRTTTSGVQAKFKLVSGGTQTLEYLDVKDNDASLGQTLTCLTSSQGCIDSGNNVNWIFATGSNDSFYFFGF